MCAEFHGPGVIAVASVGNGLRNEDEEGEKEVRERAARPAQSRCLVPERSSDILVDQRDEAVEPVESSRQALLRDLLHLPRDVHDGEA